jgi:GTP-binding protein
MPVPQVAIVGRPNVGKSSLFNWLSGRRIAIVDPTAGVTRDRLTSLIKDGDTPFELVDTGGMGIQDVDNLTADIEKQISSAIDRAAVILFVVDARDGVTPLDEEVARRLRPVTRPILMVANKCDSPELDANAADFYRLGPDRVIPVSAQQNRGKKELLQFLRQNVPGSDGARAALDVDLKVAIVGRRNTGKSTFINCLAREERVIVSEVPGTTRDSIDVRFECDGKTILAIDTAGVRRRASVATDIEFYSLARAERSIRRADVVLLFLDSRWKISKPDKQLADYIIENSKPAIFVVNKWDLVEDIPTERYGDYIHKTFPSLDYLPIAFITARDGKNVKMVLNLAMHLHKQAGARVSTNDLNRVLRQAVAAQEPPLRQNRRPKIHYGTQAAINPPTIVLFTNGPELFDLPYQRYLLKAFRDNLPFHEVPIKLFLRNKIHPGEEAPPEKKEPARKPSKPRREAKQAKKAKPAKQAELWDV